ncbi:hypothetical protein GQ42DRAFT_165209 [Ramicandelaber brevisporus]|nr:hypothetical protein GQ42DRAFT_165209 [Ramicandelaber brevisporus]
MSLEYLPYDLLELLIQQYLLNRQRVALASLHSNLHNVCQVFLYRTIGGYYGCPSSNIVLAKYGHHVRRYILCRRYHESMFRVIRNCRDVRVLQIDPLHDPNETLPAHPKLPNVKDPDVFPHLTTLTFFTTIGADLELKHAKQLVVPRLEYIKISRVAETVNVDEIVSLLKDAGNLKQLILGEINQLGTLMEKIVIDSMACTLQTLDISLQHSGKANGYSHLFGSKVRFPALKSLTLPACCEDRYSTRTSIQLNPQQQFSRVQHLKVRTNSPCCASDGSSSTRRGYSPQDALEVIWSALWPQVSHLEIDFGCDPARFAEVAANFPLLRKLNVILGENSEIRDPVEIWPFLTSFRHVEDITIYWRFAKQFGIVTNDKPKPMVAPKIRKLRIEGTPVPSSIMVELLMCPSLQELDAYPPSYTFLVSMLEQKKKEGVYSSLKVYFVPYSRNERVEQSKLMDFLPRCIVARNGYYY